MLRRKNGVEDFFAAVAAALTILQLFIGFLEVPAFFLESALVVWLIYDKIPRFLNRRFSDEDRAFTSDIRLRVGLVFFPFLMLLLFVLNFYFGCFLLPESLLGINTLEVEHSIFGIIVIVFVAIYYFSWWLWKHEGLAAQLWKMTCWTETEFKKEKATADRSRLYSLVSKYLGPGVVPMGVCVLLFMGWLVLTISDLLMAGLLLLWLLHNILHQLPLANVVSKWDNLVQRDFVWKAVTRAGIASLDSVMDAIMIIFGFVIIVLLAMIGWSTFIGVIVLFNGWYILFVLFMIGLRSSARIGMERGRRNTDQISYISMPHLADLILLCSLAMIGVFSFSVVFQLNGFVVVAFLFVAISLNIGALVTIFWWLRKQERRCRFSEQNEEEKLKLKKDLIRDRYRLYATVFFLGLPVVAAAGVFSALVVWVGMIGGLVFLCFGADFRKKIRNRKAGVYTSLLTAYMGTGIFMILGAAIYGLPELKIFLIPAGVFFAILLVVYWLAIFRIKRRWKWK